MQSAPSLRYGARVVIYLIFPFQLVLAQNKLDSLNVRVDQDQSLIQLLNSLEEQQQFQFYYIEKWLTPYRVSTDLNGLTFHEVLKKTLANTPISFALVNKTQVIFLIDQAFEKARQNTLTDAAQRQKTIKKLVIGAPLNPAPGNAYRMEGTLVNENGLPVSNASVVANQAASGALSNDMGKYSVTLRPGQHVITVSHVNYQPVIIDLEIYGPGVIDLTLSENPVYLDDVVVTAQALAQQAVGQTNLKVAELKRAPTFMGEVDVIKQIQQQPGVTTVGEISTGYHVRGGGVDQNLILLDGVPIYNSSHALGFFSAFHADAINSLSFYKSGIPASFGGRTASILNVSSKTGDYQRWHYQAGIGFISAHATANGPIRKDTSSLLVSFRTTYSNWMLRALKSNYLDLKNASANFYDGNFKYTNRIRKNTTLSLNGYISEDGFRLVNDTSFHWRNMAASVQLNSKVTDDWFTTITGGVGQYMFSLDDPEPNEAFTLQYKLLNPTLKIDFSREGLHQLNVGFQGNFYRFSPGDFIPGPQAELDPIKIMEENGWEAALYFADEFSPISKLTVEAGLRYVTYLRTGPATVSQYAPGLPRMPENVIDEVQYKPGQTIKTYHGPEPRLGVRYAMSNQASIKLGFHRLYQFMHLVSNTAVPTPVDIWQLSNGYIKPQLAHQVSLGYFRGDRETMFDFSVEGFGRLVNNSLDFKDGGILILNKQLETALVNGRMRTYGVEFSVTKKTGRWVGNVNYTYSRSLRKTDVPFAIEQVNDGNWYPSNYDQPHVLNASWRYNISRRYFISGNFVYHTGRPVSMPDVFYTVNGIPISAFSERNTHRLKDYHRMDFAFTVEGNHKRKKIFDGSWILSFYNVYGRRNPYSVFFKPNSFGRLQPYQLSLVGAIIPSFSYVIKI